MSLGIRVYVDEVPERELADKRRILAALGEQCAQRELDLTTTRAEMESFRVRYWKLVAPLYARLDEIESEIKAYEATLDPESTSARAEAEEAREKAAKSRREADLSDDEPEPAAFEASDELKKAYRRAAKAIHPDRAVDDEDRVRRNDIMARVNKAYEERDLDEIERLIDAYHAGLQPEPKLSTRESITLAEKQIAALKQRLVEIEKELMALMESDLAKLMRDVERGEAKGLNPLRELATQLEEKIAQALERLRTVRARAQGVDPRQRDEADRSVDEPVAAQLPPDEAAPPNEGTGGRTSPEDVFHTGSRIHATERGEKVRSKSEVIIANLLNQLEILYFYEFPLEGVVEPGIRRPSFLMQDAKGAILMWEHLGTPSDPAYTEKWEAKLEWYKKNGFALDETLFVTTDEMDGTLNPRKLQRVAEQIVARVSGEIGAA
jgi:hypothetical protein